MKTYELIGTLAVDSELDTVIVDGDEMVLSCDVHAISDCVLVERKNGERYIAVCPVDENDKVLKRVNVICAHDYWPSEVRAVWKDEKLEDADA
jgi:hypothetical protein